MSRLQSKIMALQGEALKVTYSIEQVNQSVLEWHDHKEELKKAVERRCAQFQFFIKRLERNLINQIDGKATEDQLYSETDQAKTDLRHNLKTILHEVSVLKGVQELGKDMEINQLAGYLLGPSVGMQDVTLTKFHYDMDVPVKPIEDVIETGFGKLSLKSEENKVFSPEITSFADAPVTSSVSREDLRQENVLVEETVSTDVYNVEEVPKADQPTPTTGKAQSRRNRNARRYKTDLGLQSEDVKAYLQQFQDARESLKDRRREILRQGQMARQDPSPMRSDLIMAERAPRMRSSSRSKRGQSTERQGIPGIQPSHQFRRASIDDGTADGASNPPPEPPIKFQFGAGASHQVLHSLKGEELQVPSPVIEEASYPSSPVKGHNVSPLAGVDLQEVKERISSPEEASGSETLLEDAELSPLPSGQRRSSQEGVRSPSSSSSSTPPEYVSLDLRGRARNSLGREGVSTRPVRRAISSAADKRSKMEFLRETWQRRKELLIQNEGFVSPESATATTSGKVRSPPPGSQSDTTTGGQQSIEVTTVQDQITSPPTSPDDAKVGRLQKIKNRLSSIKQHIKHGHTNDSNDNPAETNGKMRTTSETLSDSKTSERVSGGSLASPTAVSGSSHSPDSDSEQETVYTEVIELPADYKYTSTSQTSTSAITTQQPTTARLGTQQMTTTSRTSVLDRALPTTSSPAVTSEPSSGTAVQTTSESLSRPYTSARESYLTRMQRRYTAPVKASDLPSNNADTSASKATQPSTATTITGIRSNNTTTSTTMSTSSSTVTSSVSSSFSRITPGAITNTATTTNTTTTSTNNRYGITTPSASTTEQKNNIVESSADDLLESYRSAARNRIQNRYGIYTAPREQITAQVGVPATTSTIPTPASSNIVQTSAITKVVQPSNASTLIQPSATATITRPNNITTSVPLSTTTMVRPSTTTAVNQTSTLSTSARYSTTTGPTTTASSLAAEQRPSAGHAFTMPSSSAQTAESTTSQETVRSKPPALRLGSKHGSIQDDEPELSPTASAMAGRARPSLRASPVSPTGSDAMSNGRLREIARKKRERWRHLTIT